MDRVRESRIKLLPIQYARMTYVIDPNISNGGDPSRQVSPLRRMSFGTSSIFFSQPYIFFHYLDFSKNCTCCFIIVTVPFQYF